MLLNSLVVDEEGQQVSVQSGRTFHIVYVCILCVQQVID